jgi:CRISPR type IV-associated protein Csf2
MEGTVTCLSSISHNGGQTAGITSMLRREKFVQPDGSVEEIPLLSGNAMRGLLRDRGMLHMCKQLGYGVDEQTGTVKGLTLNAFYFLFSGGALSSDGGKTLNIDQAREMRALIPLVGLFGGALGNQIMPGRIKMGKLIPIVSETMHLMPERFRPIQPQSIWEYLQEEMYTRKDDERNEHLRTVILPAERKRLPGSLGQESLMKVEKEDYEEDTRKPQQMMYFVETLCAGTQFYWKIVLDDVTDIEFEAFLTTLAEFARLPYVGGKSNIGLGEVSVKFDGWIEVDSRLHTDSRAIASPLGKLYEEHLLKHGVEIRTKLDAI